VETNANGAQDDYPNDNNNTLAVPITIDPLLPSDLVVSNVVVPTQAIAGSQIQVSYTVTNLGNGPTDLSSWTDGVWLATDKTKFPYVTGTLLTTSVHTGVLTNDPHDPDLPQSYTQTVTVTIPDHTNGLYYLVPQTDIYQQLDATTLAGNVNPDDPNDLRSDNFKAAAITILAKPPPDLVVTAIQAPAAAAAGTPYTLSWTVANQGAGATEDSQWYDGVYLSNQPTYNPLGNADPQQINLGYFVHDGALAPGQSYTNQQSILLSPAYTGDYIIIYANTLGPSGGIGGTWEGPYGNNNTASVATDVFTAPADLQVTSVVTEPQSFSGESTTVSWTVTNFGDPVWAGTQYWNDLVWVSPDPTFIQSRATYLGNFPHTNAQPLGTNQSYTNTQSVTLPPGIGGKVNPITYYIYVQTDPLPPNPVNPIPPFFPESAHFYQSDVYEGEGANETNNTGSAPLPVYYREADLVVSNLVVPTAPPHAGDTIPVTWTVTNQGTRNTRVSTWYDGVYLSSDPSLDPNQAFFLGEFPHSGILDIGSSYTETQSVTLPYGISGNYYILVFVDDNRYENYQGPGLVLEYQDEGNNITAAPMQVLPTPLPDLQVTAVTAPQQVTENQTLAVTWTVSNTSPAPTLPGQTTWNDLVYLSVDQYLDLNSDIYLGSVSHTGALAGDAEPENDQYTVSETFQLPRGITGPYYVIVITDPIANPTTFPRGMVYEENENNNSLPSALPVIINQPPPADLVVTNIQVPATGQTGQPVTVAWTVANQGQFPASGTWTDAVYLASTPIWNISDPLVGEVQHTDSGLLTGQSYTSTLTAMLPPAIPGQYYFIVRTNLFGDVYEGTAGAANDITPSAGQMQVTVPALQLNVPLATTLTEGQNQLFQVTVPENQTLQISLSSADANAANEIYLRYNAVPTAFQYDPIHSGPLQANQTAVMPGTQAGVYYVLVSGTNNPVSLLAQLLPFEITNVTPDQGGDSAYVTTIISGAQFDPKAIVKLVMPGFAEFEPVSYQVVNSTEIIAVFDLTDAPHGQYDVSVINPDGAEADAPYSYLVEPALPPSVTIGLGGTSVMYSGDTGYYGFSLQSTTNVDIPYVQFEFGIPSLGTNITFGVPYVALSSNVAGSPDVAGVPWADLSSTVDTNGFDLASGYVMDLADGGYVGLNFTAQTYPGVPKPNNGPYFPPQTVGFTFNVEAAATPLTTAQYIDEQTQEAEFLRQSILADPTATPALLVLAQNATSWDNLYLNSLEQAGLLRPVDMPPAAQQDPNVTSMTATLAAGILAGSAGDEIITSGNLPAFFAQLEQWYGSDPTLVEPGAVPNSIPLTAPLPTASQFTLDGANPADFEAFNVYVRQISEEPDSDVVEIYFPDLNGNTQAQPTNLNQYLDSSGAVAAGATMVGPTGYGPQQFLPEGQNLPYTVQFQNPSDANTPVEQVRITQQLDPNLDPRSFRLGDLQLGDLSIPIPSGLATFQGDFDYTQTNGFILRVSAGMDLTTDTATWLLQAIDPNTGEVLQSATEGLLLAGQTGFIGYTIQPLAGLATGTQISADATVLFNNAPPLDTGTLTQTIDGTAPTTTLTATPLAPGSSNYQVTWNAQDDAGGSGVASVTVYVSEDGGDYQIWLDQTQDTSDVFQGDPGHTYQFLALATDNAGNVEQPPSGVSTPSNGSQPNLGALPTVPQTPTNVPSAPPPPPVTTQTPNPLFTQAQEGIPSSQPAGNQSEFTTVLQPFQAEAFATGIAQSHANIGPMAIVVLPDGSVLVSGGPDRNELFHLSQEGGAVGPPLATEPFPIYDMALDAQGNLWAATGGGPLLELDPTTGNILGQFGDSLTQALAIDPASGLIYVSSGQGVETFNPTTATFTHFSDLRVGSLAFNPADDSLWAALWPVDQGDIIRFDSNGQAEKMLEFSDAVNSIAFGQPGSAIAGLLFVSHDQDAGNPTGIGSIITDSNPADGPTELTMVDLATMQTLAVATGGTRGDKITTTPDGRVLLSQSLQVDVLGPVVAPRVLAVDPPPSSVVALPLGSISVSFDQDMLADNAADPNSVLNPNNYLLQGNSAGSVPIISVTYDASSRTAVLTFDALTADDYELRVLTGLRSTEGVNLAQEFDSTFTATADLSSVIDLQFGLSRSDRQTGTVSFDVTITNTSTHDLLLPVVLHLSPVNQYPGEPQGNEGRAPDGSWLIDLSGDLPANGILEPGQSSAGQTITIDSANGTPVAYDPWVSGVLAGNEAPVFVTDPVTTATVGQQYQYQAIGFDPDGDQLSYVLDGGPAGMTVDPASGLVTWTPTLTSPAQAQVVLQVYDSAGTPATQAFIIQVPGVIQPPAFNGLPAEVDGKEGVPLTLLVQATDPNGDLLSYFASNLPPGAAFDPTQQTLSWTPAYGAAGTYPDVTFTVSDGLNQVTQDVTFVIAPNPQPPTLLQPAQTIGQEGSPIQIQLQAADVGSNAPLAYSSTDFPAGATLDPNTGLFVWTPDYTQHGIYQVAFTVSNGQASTTQTANIAVLNVNAPPVFQNLNNFQVLENQQLQFVAMAYDPDNPGYVPPTLDANGTLVPGDGPPATVSYTVSGLPAGATFNPNTLLFNWTPTYEQFGAYNVTFTATDNGDGTGVDLSTSGTVTITVLPVDRPPQLTPIPDQSVQGNATLAVPVTATDPEVDNKISLTVTGLPAFGTFTDNGDGTGSFQFAPGLADKGNYTITVRATDDGRGGLTAPESTQESFVLGVQVASEPPHLDYIGDKVAVIGSPFQLTLQATDLDQQPLSFTATGLPADASLTPSSIYGQASINWVPTAADAGVYGVTFVVTNTGNGNPALVASDQQTILLVVRASNQAPVLQDPGTQTVAEGQTLTVSLSATDPDGDPLTYSVANPPPGSTFDPAHGIFTWTPNLIQAGTYPNVVFGASDGNKTAFQTITIDVTETDQPPVLLPVGSQAGRENAPVQFSLAATSPDSDPITYSAVTPLPAGAQLNPQTGQFTWTPDYTQAGNYTLTFAATVPSGLSDTTTVSIQIAKVDRPPTIQVANQSVLVGVPLNFTVLGSDPDVGDVLTYSATGLPAGASLNPNSGAFTWTPGAGQAGDYPVVFSVSDGQLSVSQTAVIHALLASQAPTVTVEVTPSFPALPGHQVVVHASATGVATIAALTLTEDGQPVTLDAQGRYFYTATTPGLITFDATATDVDGNVGQASAVVKVRDPNDTTAPVVSLDPGLNGIVLTAATNVIGTVADSNLDSWTLQIAPVGSSAFTTLATGTTPVANAALATLDPGSLLNGVYQLQLTATDIAGRTSTAQTTLEVDTDVKPGQYLRSETDLTVQLGGATVDLTRVYDSLNRNTSSSFGYGWSLAVEDTNLQTSVPLTGNESDGIYNPFIAGTRVYLTLPDGQRVGFTFTPQRHDQTGITWYTPAYTADPGVDWQLSSANAVLIRGGNGFYSAQTACPTTRLAASSADPNTR